MWFKRWNIQTDIWMGMTSHYALVYVFYTNNREYTCKHFMLYILQTCSEQSLYKNMKISDIYNSKINWFSSVSDGAGVIATVPKEARGVMLLITGQVILDHTSALLQEGWDDPTQDIALQTLTYDFICRILDNYMRKWSSAIRLTGGIIWQLSAIRHGTVTRS